jgi:hypothetical protein
MWGNQGFNQPVKSPWYGGLGGVPGEFKGPNYSLIAVRGRNGSLVDNLQFLFVDIHTGQCVETPVLGGKGGSKFEFQCLPGEWISKIHLATGQYLTSIKF